MRNRIVLGVVTAAGLVVAGTAYATSSSSPAQAPPPGSSHLFFASAPGQVTGTAAPGPNTVTDFGGFNGPSIKVNIPANAIVEVGLSFDAEMTADGCDLSGPQGLRASGFIVGGFPAEVQTSVVPSSANEFFSASFSGFDGGLLVTPGTHTFTIDYQAFNECPSGSSNVTFQNRKIWVEVMSPKEVGP
jgi:hypothetical protein